MPQMMPLYWIYLLLTCFFLVIILISWLHFHNPNFQSNYSSQDILNYKDTNISWNWKWHSLN